MVSCGTLSQRLELVLELVLVSLEELRDEVEVMDKIRQLISALVSWVKK